MAYLQHSLAGIRCFMTYLMLAVGRCKLMLNSTAADEQCVPNKLLESMSGVITGNNVCYDMHMCEGRMRNHQQRASAISHGQSE